ncbi:Gfo/Idh/MocA family protein [Arenivirga flava]|uniref:Oxidoreductase n=1 Tax=Arenivirga flava TaxID=1930060 RepID=A0AA37UHJ3_9MICO|nr:Gfo/Idh/MocA family oxidoreductase [Arenivirga flava]GMA28958.1 oxidoreductase [Arenivirga flava]
MTRRLGVGVIGAGVISTQYLENLTRFPVLDVVFVADLLPERARAQAESFSIPSHGTVDELLADDRVDIVVNLTIPAAHVEVGLSAIAAGKHVWGEKPLALDRESGRALLDAAARAGVRIASAPDTFLGAGLQTARRLIDGGAIGRPLTAVTLFQTPGPESWHPSPEFLFAVGGGPLFDVGPYYLVALFQQFGPVARVAAAGSTAHERRTIGSGPKAGTTFPVEVPTHIGATLWFESGASAQSVFSFESHRRRAGFVEISGTEGTLVFPDPNDFDGDIEIWRAGADAPEIVRASGSTSTRGTGVAELAEAILAGRAERAAGDLAYHLVDVMVSLSEAAASGDVVSVASSFEPVPLLPDGWDPTRAS